MARIEDSLLRNPYYDIYNSVLSAYSTHLSIINNLNISTNSMGIAASLDMCKPSSLACAIANSPVLNFQEKIYSAGLDSVLDRYKTSSLAYTIANSPIVNLQNKIYSAGLSLMSNSHKAASIYASAASSISPIQKHINSIAIRSTLPIVPMLYNSINESSLYNSISLHYSNYLNYANILNSNRLNIITQSIVEAAESPLNFLPQSYRSRTKFVEKEINKLQAFSNDERNYILTGAENILNTMKSIPDYELTEKAQQLIIGLIPAILLQNLTFDGLKDTVAIILSIISIYYSLQAHVDAKQAHLDAIQAHQDATTTQNQNQEIIDLLKENNELNRQLLEQQNQNNELLKNFKK